MSEADINNNSTFQNSLKMFSVEDTKLPERRNSQAGLPSPRSSTPKPFGQRISSSPNGRASPRPQLPRSPSSMSMDARASTPSLLRKASMNSLHGVGGANATPPRPSPSRRSSSSQFLNGSTMIGGSKSPLRDIEEPERPKHTAASIAHGHFEKDLALHEGNEPSRQAETIIVLHDACYGHRFSRPGTTLKTLKTIVERPERIQASVLGLSVAYVRLGERHAEGSNPLHPSQDPSTIPNAPFRIHKTTRRISLSSQAVTNVHGTKWMEELKLMCNNAEARLAMNGKELTRPDITRSPTEDPPLKLHEGDLYLCSESLNAMEGALGAVCEGVDAVFQGAASGQGPRRTFIAIRPPGHHCSDSYPSGFCWINNVHVGISHAALTHGLTHAAIIDFDLHHGDGSQAIAWEHNKRASSLAKNALPWKKTSIGYFSLHDINSYPCEYGDEEKIKNASLCIENAHGQSIWNVHLQEWKSENDFWDLYETKYSILLEKTRNFLRNQTNNFGPRAKAAIFLSAGFDASEWESSGMQRHKVNVPTEFYARLTRDVVKLAAEEGTSVDGRVISVLEGGYSDRALYTGVFSHLSGLAGGAPMAMKEETTRTGLGQEMGNRIGAFGSFDNAVEEPVVDHVPMYDPLWWSSQHLDQLDATLDPLPLAAERKPREGTPPTYSSPTQSFIAKVSTPRGQRNVSNMSNNGSPRPVSRAPSPPPPEVDWTVAAHELSKLLIPSERQTSSCRVEDLRAEATKARRDRQSILTPPEPGSEPPPDGANTRMALRTRKPTKPILEDTEEEDYKKPAAKTNRRKTVAGAAALGSRAPSRSTTPMPDPSYTKATTQSSRRLSLASNTGSTTSEASTAQTNGYSRIPSNGSTGPPRRPGTSQSVRPDSSMSSRGHSIPPVVVKKTRAPPQPRNEAAKPSRVRRKSPLNSESAAQASTSNGIPVTQSNDAAIPKAEASNAQSSEMDTLTDGMKKIKLSLTTKAQREAKELKTATKPAAKSSGRAPSAKTAKSRPLVPAHAQKEPAPILPPKNNGHAPQAPVAPAPAELAPTQPLLAPTPPEPSTSNGAIEPSTTVEPTPPMPSTPPKPLQHVFPAQVYEPINVPLPASSPMAASPKTPVQAPTDPNVFIPYQPEGPTPSIMPPQDPLRWLPPNTTVTPSPMKRDQLPVFTSTSAIPFGVKKEEVKKYDDSIWEVPETPKK